MTVTLAACSSTPELPLEVVQYRAAAVLRAAEFDKALYCGAEKPRVLDMARTEPAPTTVPPPLVADYHVELVSRIHAETSLRGVNPDDPQCATLRARRDLARLWPASAPVRPARRRAPARPPAPTPAE